MDGWTSQVLANATPAQVLEVLTHPGQIRRWSPIEFDAENLDCRPLAAGTRTKVSGRVAGVPVSFDVEVHAADQDRLEISAEGPIGLEVRYDLAPAADGGSEMKAWVRVRSGGGLTGRLVAKATSTLLSAGALDGATVRIARAAESHSYATAA